MSRLGRGRGLISDTDSGAPGARRRLSLAVPSSPEGTGWAARDTEDAIASRGCRQSLASSPEDPMGRSSPSGHPAASFPTAVRSKRDSPTISDMRSTNVHGVSSRARSEVPSEVEPTRQGRPRVFTKSLRRSPRVRRRPRPRICLEDRSAT